MKRLTLPILICCMMLFSCKTNPVETPIDNSGLLEITKAQFESGKMALGKPQRKPFSDLVHFTGVIVPSPNGKAQLSLPVPGTITKILCNPGQQVFKGAVLFEISGHAFIDMQRDFAESGAQLSRLTADYERSKALAAENITTQKEFMLAESGLYAEQARYNALKIKLGNLGLDVTQIEKGTFFSTFSLRSPIQGYVTTLNAILGQYVDPQIPIAEITDAESLQLSFSVFEGDIQKITRGQVVEFTLAKTQPETLTAIISTVGRAVNQTTRAVDCLASIPDLDNMNLVSHQFVDGNVLVSPDTSLAVPVSALLKSASLTYVLELAKETEEAYFFEKKQVTTGRENSGLVELMENLGEVQLLVEGTHNLQIE